jgi:hypothetical protein
MLQSWVKIEVHTVSWCEKPQENKQFEDTGVDTRIILKLILRKQAVMMQLHSSD